MHQGHIDDCYLLSALSSIAKVEKRIANILLQIHIEEGRYTVLFYKAGKQQEIFVDDKLPFHNGQLIFSQAKN